MIFGAVLLWCGGAGAASGAQTVRVLVVKATWGPQPVANVQDFTGPTATFFGPSEGHDGAVISAGVAAQWTPAVSTYVNYDGQLGRGNYSSNAVTGGVRISF